MLLLAIGAAAAAAQAQPNSVVGRWQTQSRGGVVEIARCGASICGRLADSPNLRTNPNLLDTNNKDKALRGRKLLNLQMIEGFSWKNGAWDGGRIYNAEDGGTYKATITPVDANQLKLKGCIVWPLCKTQIWTRIR